jgi:hypothetical protein
MDVNSVLEGTLSPGQSHFLDLQASWTVAWTHTNLLIRLDATIRHNAEQQLTQAANANFVCYPKLQPYLNFTMKRTLTG